MKIISPGSAYAPGQTPYDIFKDRMVAISSIASGIKEMIANKYVNNQITMIADNILNKIDETKSTELIDLITGKPPEEIYPDNLEDTVGAFIDKFAIGPMMQKEKMMGNLGGGTPQGTLPALTGPAPAPGETMIPKPDISQLFSAISSMPSGDVNWANLFKTMTEKKPWFMGPTGPESVVMEKMMGQMKDPKAELEADIELAKLVEETFYPKAGKPTDFDKRLATFMMTDPTVPEMKKFLGGHIAGTTPVDIESIFANIPEGFELSSYNISTTGAPSFSFRPTDTTTPYEFKTWDEAKAFLDTHPQEGFVGKIETEKGGFDVTFYKGGTEDELKPITPSDIKSFNTMLFGDGEFPGVTTLAEYEKVKDYIVRSKKDFPTPEYLEIAETNVGRCLDTDNSVLDIELYRFFYKYYKEALKGKTPKYLPPEMIEKTGFWKNKFGSALVEDYELDFAAMKKDGVTKEDIEKKLKEISER
jgi:hypothetical protein